jgi:hypothetical protein
MENKEALHEMLFNMLCCSMCADMKIHINELHEIHAILKELQVPWGIDEIKRRITDFINLAQSKGFNFVLDQTFDQIEKWDYPEEGKKLLDYIDRMNDADGRISQSEVDVKQKFRAAFSLKTKQSHSK